MVRFNIFRFRIFNFNDIAESEKRKFPVWALLLCLAIGVLIGWLLNRYCYLGGESGVNI